MNKEASRRWSSGNFYDTCPDLPSAFELKIQKLGLANSPDKWAASPKLRAWVRANRNKRFVPESLLLEFNLMGFYEGE